MNTSISRDFHSEKDKDNNFINLLRQQCKSYSLNNALYDIRQTNLCIFHLDEIFKNKLQIDI